MYHRFHLSVERFFANPLDYAKNYSASVKRGDRQKIEYGKVHPYKARNLQKVVEAARFYDGGGRGNGSYRSAHRA